MQLAEERPNVELRRDPGGGSLVVLSFPYDPQVVALVRRIPGRRFDWDRREWYAPVDDWAGVHVADVVDRFPELTTSTEVDLWLRAVERRWVGRITTTRHDGGGWFALHTRAGEIPEALQEGSVEQEDGTGLVPLAQTAAEASDELRAARVDGRAQRTLSTLLGGLQPVPPARLVLHHGSDGERLKLEVLWDPDTRAAFEALPGAEDAGRVMPLDPWVVDTLDGFLARHDVHVTGGAADALDDLRAQAAPPGRAPPPPAGAPPPPAGAGGGEPIPEVAAKMGGTLQPFQWAGVRYALDARRTFIADEQGLGKTVEALATLEADDAFPAVVICPASLKLNWERETRKWVPHRSVVIVEGKQAVPETGDITILTYEIVAAHREHLARMHPRALVVDESHYAKNPSAKRTQAVRRLAGAIDDDALRLALTGTPVLNHADELISQLRVIGRLEDFGSGARFSRQFQGPLTEERLHWHLRRRCFVRRLKREVLPQLPPKRRVVVPVAMDKERDYGLAEEEVIEWLLSQPLDLAELDAKIAAALRAQRLAQLGALQRLGARGRAPTAPQRLAARGKLNAALVWIEDFLASGEPLVVFARHVDVQRAVLERFPDALHLLGADALAEREAAVRAFQQPGGPQLIVGATRVAAQGITLTRASNVAFLELEWTPAMHDQAEDRTHRIGQRDAVTAWYLLAAGTIDETMAELVESKRSHISAVTDGRRLDGENLVHAVVRELREGRPFRHLRPVA